MGKDHVFESKMTDRQYISKSSDNTVSANDRELG